MWGIVLALIAGSDDAPREFFLTSVITKEECICRKSLASQAVSLDVIF